MGVQFPKDGGFAAVRMLRRRAQEFTLTARFGLEFAAALLLDALADQLAPQFAYRFCVLLGERGEIGFQREGMQKVRVSAFESAVVCIRTLFVRDYVVHFVRTNRHCRGSAFDGT